LVAAASRVRAILEVRFFLQVNAPLSLGGRPGNGYDEKEQPFGSAKSLLNLDENDCLISSWYF